MVLHSTVDRNDAGSIPAVEIGFISVAVNHGRLSTPRRGREFHTKHFTLVA